jgi:carbon storage regulator CsrA
MLVLSRKQGESILIDLNGKEVIVKVLRICTRTNQVRVGIEAEKDVSILRTEIIDRESVS